MLVVNPEPVYVPRISLDNLAHRLDIVFLAPDIDTAAQLTISPSKLMKQYSEAGLEVTLVLWAEQDPGLIAPSNMNLFTSTTSYCPPDSPSAAQINGFCAALEACKDNYYVFSAILDTSLVSTDDYHLEYLKGIHTVPHNKNNYITNMLEPTDPFTRTVHEISLPTNRLAHSIPRFGKREFYDKLCVAPANEKFCGMSLAEAMPASQAERGPPFSDQRHWRVFK